MPRVLELQDLSKRTIPDLLDRSRTFGLGRPFLVDLSRDDTFSYSAFLDRVAGAAVQLVERFAPGDRIVIMASNTKAYFILRYALSCAGLIEVAINGAHRGAVLKNMLELAQPHAVVVESQFLDNLRSSGFDLDENLLIDDQELEQLTSAVVPWRDRPKPSIKPGAPARILLTSGTSERSKCVELSHAYEVYTGERHNGLLGIGRDDRWLYVTPLFHIDAVYIVSILLHTGGCFILAPNFSLFRFWQDVSKSKATYLCYLGSLLALLMKGPDAPLESTLRIALGGGASKSLIEQFEARFGMRVLEAFAMTECIACTLNRFDDRRLGSVGRPIEGYEVTVVDGQDRALPPGKTGEIVVRADEPYGLFTRYVGDPCATETAMRGGWFHTGDLGTYDNDGYMFYRGRKKDVIRRRGENISAMELETVADAHPAVLGSAAVGVPSDLEDEEILLYVEPKHGTSLDPSELFVFLKSQVAPFMVPRYIRVIDELPRTEVQKVLKSALATTPDEFTWSSRPSKT